MINRMYILLEKCYIDANKLKSFGVNIYAKRRGMPTELTAMYGACRIEHLRAIRICDKQDNL